MSIERKIVEIENTLYRLGKEISESALSNPLLIGIPRRGDLLTKRISKYLTEFKFKHDIDTVNYRPFRDDLDEELEKTSLNITPEDRDVVLIDDVIYTGRTIKAALDALQSWGRAKRVTLLAMVDRGHREVPIQPDFCGRVVPTSKDETIDLRLRDVDGEEGVFLCKKNYK